MKKLFLLLIVALALVIPKPCPAADRACQSIWDNVAGQTYILGDYEIVFGESWVGPCPQSACLIYDGIHIEPCLTCKYYSGADNMIYINCGDGDIPFILRGDRLELYVKPPLVMQRKVEK